MSGGSRSVKLPRQVLVTGDYLPLTTCYLLLTTYYSLRQVLVIGDGSAEKRSYDELGNQATLCASL